uniref:Uncharacterized protein n=1 Tax=Parascaris equorum TaxID=6256 RepID=A0A914S6W6_PAREQ
MFSSEVELGPSGRNVSKPIIHVMSVGIMQNGTLLHVYMSIIDELWSNVKRKFNTMLRTLKANFETYISVFLFSRMTRNDAFVAWWTPPVEFTTPIDAALDPLESGHKRSQLGALDPPFDPSIPTTTFTDHVAPNQCGGLKRKFEKAISRSQNAMTTLAN